MRILPQFKEQIQWFETSPDAGLPECICSLCGKVIGTPWWEQDEEESDEIPIRLFDTDRNLEARFHLDCFAKVTGTRIGGIRNDREK